MDLPKHPVVHGHPVHAILSGGPAVLIPVALAAEVWRRSRKDSASQKFSDVATLTATTAAASAAMVGCNDWQRRGREPLRQRVGRLPTSSAVRHSSRLPERTPHQAPSTHAVAHPVGGSRSM